MNLTFMDKIYSAMIIVSSNSWNKRITSPQWMIKHSQNLWSYWYRDTHDIKHVLEKFTFLTSSQNLDIFYFIMAMQICTCFNNTSFTLNILYNVDSIGTETSWNEHISVQITSYRDFYQDFRWNHYQPALL